jgi:ribonuclease-3
VTRRWSGARGVGPRGRSSGTLPLTSSPEVSISPNDPAGPSGPESDKSTSSSTEDAAPAKRRRRGGRGRRRPAAKSAAEQPERETAPEPPPLAEPAPIDDDTPLESDDFGRHLSPEERDEPPAEPPQERPAGDLTADELTDAAADAVVAAAAASAADPADRRRRRGRRGGRGRRRAPAAKPGSSEPPAEPSEPSAGSSEPPSEPSEKSGRPQPLPRAAHDDDASLFDFGSPSPAAAPIVAPIAPRRSPAVPGLRPARRPPPAAAPAAVPAPVAERLAPPAKPQRLPPVQSVRDWFSPERLAACQNAIGYHFRDVTLLENALTHSSIKSEDRPSYERMEFLGDSVIGLVISSYLYDRLPDCDEGDLTKVKSAVVSTDGLASAARACGLDRFLAVGRGIQMKDAVPKSLIADVFEGVVGAVYLDRGYEAVRLYVLDLLHPHIDEALSDRGALNFKSVLQQVAQRDFGETPYYDVLRESGPEHSRVFEVVAVIGKRRFGVARASTKKEAEQAGAKLALQTILVEKSRKSSGRRRHGR